MIVNRIVVLFVFVCAVWSCKKDNDDDTPAAVPPRPLAEVATEDDAKIQEFLKTHFYNYEEFASAEEGFDFKITIDTLAGENADKTPLIEQVTMETISVASTDLGITEEQITPVSYYYLVAREGKGGSPTIADSTYFSYEGRRLDNFLFDSSTTYTWQYMPNFLRGFVNGIAKLNAGDTILVNDDGTTSIENTGVGLVIFPSGLGYYDTARTNIPAYSPLLFKLELGLYNENTDFDNDGIPSIMEDVNGDGNVNNDNTDDDFVQTLMGVRPLNNHEDPDDDNDGIPTREEIEIDAEGNITFPDTDGDLIPDYLDSDS